MKITLVAFLALLTAPSLAGDIVGWRTDNSGSYPDAKPPTEWSANENVIWKTALPGRGYSSPILVGDRILVGSEPSDIVCLDAATGEVVWKHSITGASVLGEEKFTVLKQQHDELLAASKKVRREMKDAEGEKRDQLKERDRELKEKARDLALKFPIGQSRGAGNACATPVSDGKHVFVSFGTGIVAGFTVEGKLLWHKFVEGSRLGFGHASSPVLADGLVIVHFNDLIALDAATGDERWRETLPARYATPVVLADQPGGSFLITPSGAVVRAKDGSRIGATGLNVSECTPLVVNGVLYGHAKGRVQAFRLPDFPSEDEPELLWDASGTRDRRTPSAVLYDGLLYGVNTSGIMEVVDAETGDIAYRRRLGLRKVYSSISAAGGYIFVTGTDGTTLVIKAGPKFQEVATNKLESCGSCLVFAGDRLYLRGDKHLFCIGN